MKNYKMNPNISVCSLPLLLLLNFVGAKPVSDLQSLKQLLAEEINTAPYSSSEQLAVEGKDGNAELVFGAREQYLWDSSNWALAVKENIFTRLLKDLTKTSKHSWSRYKKGGLRSCFGVRLERIGSFSGLGC